MNNIQISIMLFLATIMFFGMFACSSSSTPPAPDMAAGVYINVGYEFFKWKEGLALMIWHDAISSSSCSSSGSTDNPMPNVDCHAVSSKGQRFDWQIKTIDGLNAEFSINNERYDLSEGDIFIVELADGMTDIQQVHGDLTNVSPDNDSIVAYGLSHVDIKQFIQSTSSLALESVTPEPDAITITPTPWIDIEYPPDTRTGILGIDRVIDTILGSDIESRIELVRYIQNPCTTADGLGGPPKCQADEVDGTIVTAFPVLYSEGTHVRPEHIRDVFDFSVRGLLAVYVVPESAYKTDDWPAGETAIVFTSEDGGHAHTVTLHVTDGEVIRLEFHPQWPPFDWIWDRSDNFILPPSTRPSPNP